MVTRVLYTSTPEFGIPTLRLLAEDTRFELAGVVTQPDKPAGRGLKLTPPPVKVAALELSLPVLQPLSLRTAGVQTAIRALEPDVGAMVAYGQWMPAEVFDLPPKRTLNLHPSLLPRHRGAAPVPGALLAGDREVGLSVHFVEDEMDAGDVLAQLSMPVGADDTAGSLMARLSQAGAPFFVEALAAWVGGEIIPQPQDHSQATWIDRLEKSAGLLDWSLPAEHLARCCRAFSPWPGTYTFFEGKRLLVHRAEAIPVADGALPSGEPGIVVQAGSEVAVVTGDGLLRLDQVQLEGRRRLDIQAFVRGQRMFVGAVLG
ncbi:MAG: methionyl-tRNA formyltransferase [Anaerolineae bacterium]|jgi:methionyl-tRNA formyltransferase